MKQIVLCFGLWLISLASSEAQIISQYVETNSGSTPKGIEIWNNTGNTLDFSVTNLVIEKGNNGKALAADFTLSTGTLSPDGVIVIGTSDMTLTTTNNGAQFEEKAFTFNGDDALVVKLDGIITDIFGAPGIDPGAAWSGNGVSTANQNIQLLPSITTGFTTPGGWTDPSTRFVTVSTNPSGPDGLSGFGLLPSSMFVQITGDAGWRLLAAPTTGFTVADISDDTAIQGVVDGTDPSFAANFIIYDQTGAFEQPTNVSTSFGDGLGFGVFFFHNSNGGSSPLPITLDVTGSEPSSDVIVPLNGGAAGNFTLVGNPFASNIQANQISATGGVVGANISYWNDNDGGGGSYLTVDRTLPASILPPWLGFWVETSDAAVSSITFPTSAKTATASSLSGSPFGTTIAKIAGSPDVLFELRGEGVLDRNLKLSFREGASLGADIWDATKLVPLSATYATLSFLSERDGNDWFQAVHSLPTELAEPVELLFVPDVAGAAGEFTFAWEGLASINSEFGFTLSDLETGAIIDMREVTSYRFEMSANKSAKAGNVTPVAVALASEAASRFKITVDPTTITDAEDNKIGLPQAFELRQNYPNPFNPSTRIEYSLAQRAQVTLEVFDVMGRRVATLVNGQTQAAGTYTVSFEATNLASGLYLTRLRAGGRVLTQTMTLLK